MLTTGRQASRTRWLGAALALALAALGLLSFYRYGSSPTDENLFSRPTSPAMLPQAIAGDEDETLHAGDLLLRVGERRIDVVADVTRALDAASDDTVEVLALRPATLERFVIHVPTAELREVAVRDVGQAALVHTLVPNGASDRAGMQVGDLIVRINGQSFRNIYEADAIMRSGIAGRVTEYQVIRQGVPRTLYVTLAAFGVAVAPLLALLTGFAWLLLGAALMLLRPGIAAARDLGLALILLGYAIMVGYIPRNLPQGGMEHLRDLVMIAAASLGLALWVQAIVSFPRERPALRERRWLVPGAYVLGAVGGVAVYLNRAPIVGIVAFLAMVVYAWAGTWLGKDRRLPDESKVRLPLRIATWTAIAAALAGMALTTLPGVVNNGFVSVGFLGVPLAIIYTIGRYRLLDLDLRVRRSVQYFFASAAWIGALVIALLWLLTVLPNVDLPLPHLRMSRASVELLDQPMTDDERAPLEKAALMVVAIGLAFVAQRVGRRGLEWIASRFHRPTHDYRRASRDLATLVGSRLDLEGLADGLIDTTVGLLPVKRAGVMFIHGPTTYWGRNAHGFPGRHWEELCASAADIVQGIGKATAEVNAQYAFPRLRRALEAADVLHLYPIRSHDKLVGTLLVGDKLSEAAFSADDFEFIGAIAQQIAPAVDNSFLYEELAEQERLKHELEIARRIQLESLPQFTPLIEGLDVSGVSVPAFEVGGDYFDYLNGSAEALHGDGRRRQRQRDVRRALHVEASRHSAVAARLQSDAARAVREDQSAALSGSRAALVRHRARRVLRHRRGSGRAGAGRAPAALPLRRVACGGPPPAAARSRVRSVAAIDFLRRARGARDCLRHRRRVPLHHRRDYGVAVGRRRRVRRGTGGVAARDARNDRGRRQRHPRSADVGGAGILRRCRAG